LGPPTPPHRIDIADLTDMATFKIKPVRGYGNAGLQLWQYVHNFNFNLSKVRQSTVVIGGGGWGYCAPATIS
jgi:hypothetical protein